MQPNTYFASTGIASNRLLDTVGDGSGAIDLRVNGATTAVDFNLSPPEGHIYLLHSLHVYVSGSPLSSIGWAGGSALTNGLDFGVTLPTGFVSAIPQKKIQANGDFAIVGCDTAAFLGSGTDSYTAALHFAETYGGPRKIQYGESYTVKVQDDLTTAGDGTYVQIGFLDVKL